MSVTPAWSEKVGALTAGECGRRWVAVPLAHWPDGRCLSRWWLLRFVPRWPDDGRLSRW
ncbi:MAG: hypothetical protein HQL80_11030 [Magnetococcales bacterium]|nr:hypothetical protein [Magnetococcales bacterium]